MRIISWNMQGQMINASDLRAMLNSVAADALLAQEPYAQLSLTATESRTRHAQPTGPTWTTTHIAASGLSASQDRYAVAVNEHTTLGYTVVAKDPTGSKEAGVVRQYLIAKLKKGNSSIKVATCHAPLCFKKELKGNQNVTAALYMLYLMNELTAGFLKSTGMNAEKKTVDVFIGDTNVYDSNECNYKGWVNALSSCTGGRGKGGALDRILIRAGQLNQFRCGRIYVAGNDVARLSSRDRKSGAARDLELEDTKLNRNWMRSDHLAIYLDTDPGKDGVFDKRRRDEKVVEEFWELDRSGKPKKLKTEGEKEEDN